MRYLIIPFVFCVLMSLSSASAAVVVGLDTFHETAFADVVLDSSGLFNFIGHEAGPMPTTLEQSVLGFDINTGAEADPSSSQAHIALGFVDNPVINGPGADLVFYEISGSGVTEDFLVRLTSGGPAAQVVTTDTGIDIRTKVTSGGISDSQVNRGELDLSDMGVGFGESVSSIFIEMVSSGMPNPDLTLVGAVHVPEPATMSLLALGAMALLRRRKR